MARAELVGWEQRGYRVLGVLDRDYPENLRLVHDRPPLLFVQGSFPHEDTALVAIIGSRRASAEGLEAARLIAIGLAARGLTIVSGMAAGIDTAAHVAALDCGARTAAVLGTGLDHCFPPGNAALQRRIASQGALLSGFFPETPPSRQTFPQRNAVMSGVALGSVIVEASSRSGSRVQARLALGHGRPVFLWRPLLRQEWARDLARKPGVHVVDDPEAVAGKLERLHGNSGLVE
jgi:DNA processing protein